MGKTVIISCMSVCNYIITVHDRKNLLGEFLKSDAKHYQFACFRSQPMVIKMENILSFVIGSDCASQLSY